MSSWFRSRGLRKAFVLVLVLGLLQAVPVGAQEDPGPDVTEAEGLAFNYYTDVSLFGGPFNRRGYLQDELAAERGQPPPPETAASPSVECPEGGGADSVHDPDGARAVYGPAVIFGGIWPHPESPTAPPSGPLTSSIDCALGVDGYVTASTLVTLMPGATRVGGHRPDEGGEWVEPTPTWSNDYPHPGGIGPGPLIADEVESTCTMTADGTVTSDVRFVNGFVETSYDPDTQEPATWEDIPDNPPAGHTVEGTIDHVGDSFRITFNDQTENPDGSFTVVAAHMELLGPTAVGDMVVGSSTCGPVTSESITTTTLPDVTTTTVPDVTTTTLPDVTTTTLPDVTTTTLPDVTTTTVPDGTTTTLPETTTTTTVPDGTTTTTVPDGTTPPPSDAECVDLRISDDQVVGEVCVTNTVTSLLVAYTTTGDWQLRATRLHVAQDADDIPRDGEGNAGPRRFDHYQPLNRPPVMSFVHTIPLADLDASAGDQLVVAAQADVQRRANGGGQIVSAWAEGTPFRAGDVQASSHGSSNNEASFFTYAVEDATGMTCADVRAGQNETAGEVCARDAAGDLLVTYHTAGEWQLRATRLHATEDVDSVPRDRVGHPHAREFDHWAPHSAPVTSFTHTIPLADLGAAAGDELVVAAQADVRHPTSGGGTRTVSGWAGGEQFDSDHDHGSGFAHTYTYFTHPVG